MEIVDKTETAMKTVGDELKKLDAHLTDEIKWAWADLKEHISTLLNFHDVNNQLNGDDEQEQTEEHVDPAINMTNEQAPPVTPKDPAAGFVPLPDDPQSILARENADKPVEENTVVEQVEATKPDAPDDKTTPM